MAPNARESSKRVVGTHKVIPKLTISKKRASEPKARTVPPKKARRKREPSVKAEFEVPAETTAHTPDAPVVRPGQRSPGKGASASVSEGDTVSISTETLKRLMDRVDHLETVTTAAHERIDQGKQSLAAQVVSMRHMTREAARAECIKLLRRLLTTGDIKMVTGNHRASFTANHEQRVAALDRVAAVAATEKWSIGDLTLADLFESAWKTVLKSQRRKVAISADKRKYNLVANLVRQRRWNLSKKFGKGWLLACGDDKERYCKYLVVCMRVCVHLLFLSCSRFILSPFTSMQLFSTAYMPAVVCPSDSEPERREYTLLHLDWMSETAKEILEEASSSYRGTNVSYQLT
jgi:hypothetical protein